MIRCLKWAVETSVSGTLAYMPVRPRACLGFSVVSALRWEQLLAGVLALQSPVPKGSVLALLQLRES